MNVLARISVATAALALAFVPAAGSAVSTAPHARTVDYVAALKPRHAGVPFSGKLRLTFSPNGIVNGTYRAQSIRPDPMNGRIVTVGGGLTGNKIHLSFGMSGRFTISGTLAHDGSIVASGFGPYGRLYDFEAVPSGATH